jgi:rubredoxin
MPGKRLDIENGEVVDSDDSTDDDDRPELPDNRCSVCTWTGTDDDVTDDQRCPQCGYGVVAFNVRWADTDDGEDDGTDEGLYEYHYGQEGSQ